MTKHYKIHIISNNTNLKVSYRNGKFFKLEKLTGKLTDEQIRKIGAIIPPHENVVENYQFTGKITIIPIEKTKTLYTAFLDAWFAFYDNFMGIKPRFNGTDGKHLKSIINYLTELSQDEKEALSIWQLILHSWDNLDDFYKNSADLKFISSQINKILINVKANHKTGSKTVSSDYIKSVMRDLQSD